MGRSTRDDLFVHLVWGTYRRRPWLVRQVRPHVFEVIQAQAGRVGAEVIAVGGMEDHVHVLARFPARLAVAALAHRIKGGSSRFISRELLPGHRFRWQDGYGAFSLSRTGIPAVRAYVLNQEHHHTAGTLYRALEPSDPA